MIDLPLLGAPLDFLRGADGLAAHLTAMFFVSAAFYRYRDRVPLRLDLAAVSLLALVLSLGTPLERPVLLIAIPYLVLCAAYRSVRWTAPPDSAGRRLLRDLPLRLSRSAGDLRALGRLGAEPSFCSP